MASEAVAGSSRGASAEEAALVAAASSGDAGAFEEIVRRHADLVLGLGTRVLGSRTEADDLLQEVFLRVHRALASFRGEAQLKSWIAQVTVNAARNRLRAAKRRGLHVTSSLDAPLRGDPDGGDGALMSDRLEDGAPDPERVAAGRQAAERLEGALRRLPLEFREAIVLREIEGLSYEEIADVLSVNVGTVKSRISRARARLQAELSDLVTTPPRGAAT